MARNNNLENLLPNLLKGDQQAFRKLVDVLATSLYSYAYSIVHEKDMAQDVVQETFLNLHKAFRHGKKIDSLQTFSFHVATRRAYDALKSRKNRHMREQYAAQSFQTFEHSNNPSLHAQACEAWELVKSLPSDIRDVINLRFAHGLTSSEISQTLSIPASTVRRKQKEGLEQLAQKFATLGLPGLAQGFQIKDLLSTEGVQPLVNIPNNLTQNIMTQVNSAIGATSILALGGFIMAKKIALAATIILALLCIVIVFNYDFSGIHKEKENTEQIAAKKGIDSPQPQKQVKDQKKENTTVPNQIPSEEPSSVTKPSSLQEKPSEPTPSESITAPALSTITVHVLVETETPLPNVRVELLRELKASQTQELELIERLYTDHNGNAIFKNVPPNKDFVVKAVDKTSDTEKVVYTSQQVVVQTRANENTDCTIEVMATKQNPWITGRFINENGKPCAGASFRIHNYITDSSSSPPLGDRNANNNGEFSFYVRREKALKVKIDALWKKENQPFSASGSFFVTLDGSEFYDLGDLQLTGQSLNIQGSIQIGDTPWSNVPYTLGVRISEGEGYSYDYDYGNYSDENGRFRETIDLSEATILERVFEVTLSIRDFTGSHRNFNLTDWLKQKDKPILIHFKPEDVSILSLDIDGGGQIYIQRSDEPDISEYNAITRRIKTSPSMATIKNGKISIPVFPGEYRFQVLSKDSLSKVETILLFGGERKTLSPNLELAVKLSLDQKKDGFFEAWITPEEGSQNHGLIGYKKFLLRGAGISDQQWVILPYQKYTITVKTLMTGEDHFNGRQEETKTYEVGPFAPGEEVLIPILDENK